MKLSYVVLVLSFQLMVSNVLNAQFKVKEKSSKKQPQWILSPAEDQIVGLADGITLEESKKLATDSLVNKVSDIIAGKMVEQNRYFKSFELSKEEARYIFSLSEFIKKISSENTLGMYWEKLINKKTDEVRYTYYLNYPLNDQVIQKILQNLEDKSLSDTLSSLNELLEKSRNVQIYKNVWKKAMFLNPLFPDESENKKKCDQLLKEIDQVFSKIEIKEVMNIPGKLIIAQTLNDRGVITSVPPKIISDCIKILSIDNSNEKWIVNYSFSKCRSTSPHKVEVYFDNYYNAAKAEIPIDINREVVDIQMSNTTIFIKGKMITFYVSSTYRKNALLERVVFRYNDINFTDTKLNQLLDGPGLYNFSFDLPYGFEDVELEDSVRGEIYFRPEHSNHQEVYHFYNQSIKRN